jgi:hypothetical protein
MAAKPKFKAIDPKNLIEKEAIEALETPEVWQNFAREDVKEEFLDLERLRFRDIEARLKNRENFRRFLMGLLVGQNVLVFTVFALGMWYDKIAGLETVFSTLVGGTLLETTALIYIIVKWLFSEIPYQKPTQSSPIT